MPHRDRGGGPSAGSAAYLCMRDEERGAGLRAALFTVNDLGEPLDFSFSRVDVPDSFLWRAGEARSHAARALAMTLFDAAPGAVDVVVSTPGDVPAAVLVEDLEIDVPVCHLTSGPGGADEGELVVTWLNGEPAEGAPARRVLRRLMRRNLALEPFERAAAGLREVLPAP